MNAQTTVALALALLMQNGTFAADDVGWETDAVFVREGDARSTREIGDEWTHKQGALLCGGMDNYLVAGKATGAGDFRIRARLSLQQLDATAASLVIGGNQFGFDGQSKKFFVEGPDSGPPRSLRDARKFIAPGKPFEVDVTRRGETLSFRIDGIEVHAGKYRLASTCAIGLRPWRGTMRVYDFSASGDLKPVTETTIRAMLFHHPDGKTLVAFHHNRHSGVHFKSSDRSEIWLSLWKDLGRTWSEPRFVFANALAATSGSAWHDSQCSYLDAFADVEDLHLFVPHRWKRVLHLTLRGEDVRHLPSQRDLIAGVRLREGADSD